MVTRILHGYAINPLGTQFDVFVGTDSISVYVGEAMMMETIIYAGVPPVDAAEAMLYAIRSGMYMAKYAPVAIPDFDDDYDAQGTENAGL